MHLSTVSSFSTPFTMSMITQQSLSTVYSLPTGQLAMLATSPMISNALRAQSRVQRGISTHEPRNILRPASRDDTVQQKRRLHINTTSKTDSERRITVPRSQAGEALQALRGTPLPARRLHSTRPEHTSVSTELSSSRICSQCKDKFSEQSAQSTERRISEPVRGANDDDFESSFGSFCVVLGVGTLVVLNIAHIIQ